MLKLGMLWSSISIPAYVCMMWFVIKHKENIMKTIEDFCGYEEFTFWLSFNGLDGVISQKIRLFMKTTPMQQIFINESSEFVS
jgi:predicted DNA-binding protein with PD1-like motif